MRKQEINVILNDLKTHEITVEDNLVDIMNKKERLKLSNEEQNNQRRTSQESVTENEGKRLFKNVRMTNISHNTILHYVNQVTIDTLSTLPTINAKVHMDSVYIYCIPAIVPNLSDSESKLTYSF